MSQFKLITTADYKYTKSSVLFLGKWCLNYKNKKTWETMNYKIFDSKLFDIENNQKINEKSQEIYEKILNELSKKLNVLHKVNWPKRSWRILIGPWLYRYISCLSLRINLIKEAKNKINNLTIEEDENVKKMSLASYDLEDFSNKMLLDKYNKYLFIKIFNLLDSKSKIYLNNLKNCKLENKETLKESLLIIYKNKLIKFLEKNLCRKNNFIFFKIYIGNALTTLKLFFKLKEFPFRYNTGDKRYFFHYDKELREKIFKDNKKNNEYEQIIEYFLPEVLPTVYLEGFGKINKQVNKSFLPDRKIRFIYTCNLSSDILFKFWTSKKVSEGTKIIYGQHGANTNFSKDNFKTNHEIDISDNYISWGWKSNNEKVKKGYCFNIIAKDFYKKIENSKYLFVLPPTYHYHFYNKISFFNDLKLGEKEHVLASTKLNLDFLEKNKSEIKNIHIRLHPNDYRTETPFKPLLEKRFKNINFDNSKDILKTFEKYDLIIFGYLEATPFLHCLALNKPCMVLSPLNKDILNEENQTHWEIFKNLGIINFLPFNIKQRIQKIGGKLNNWWYDENIQTAIKNFTYSNAFKDKKSIERIVNILTDLP